MNDIVVARGGELQQFDPQKTRDIDAQADAVIEYARRVKDWPALELAIDKKIEEQAEFVQWWRENVSSTKGGDRRSDQSRRSGTLIALQAETLTGITKQQVSKWSRRLQDVTKYREQLYGAAYKAAMAQADAAHVSHNSGDNEWYTPETFIEAARRTMGGIDLDPASSEIANKTVKAKQFYTSETDGLGRKWFGRVWMNPPYSQPLCAKFCSAAASEFGAGKIQQACVLINNATETAWFQELLSAASAICFPKGRVRFIDPEGNPSGSPLQGQAVIYLGPNVPSFVNEFDNMGIVLFHGWRGSLTMV